MGKQTIVTCDSCGTDVFGQNMEKIYNNLAESP
jgi:hypothetical protein